MNIEEKNKICELYFDKKQNYSQIMESFNGKYIYAEIKKIIKEKING